MHIGQLKIPGPTPKKDIGEIMMIATVNGSSTISRNLGDTLTLQITI